MVILTTYNDLGIISPRADPNYSAAPAGQGSHMGSFYESTGTREPRLGMSFQDRLSVSLPLVATSAKLCTKPISNTSLTIKSDVIQSVVPPRRKMQEPIETVIRGEQNRKVKPFQPINIGRNYRPLNTEYGSGIYTKDINAAGYSTPDRILEMYSTI